MACGVRKGLWSQLSLLKNKRKRSETGDSRSIPDRRLSNNSSSITSGSSDVTRAAPTPESIPLLQQHSMITNAGTFEHLMTPTAPCEHNLLAAKFTRWTQQGFGRTTPIGWLTSVYKQTDQQQLEKFAIEHRHCSSEPNADQNARAPMPRLRAQTPVSLTPTPALNTERVSKNYDNDDRECTRVLPPRDCTRAGLEGCTSSKCDPGCDVTRPQPAPAVRTH